MPARHVQEHRVVEGVAQPALLTDQVVGGGEEE
jgi:hypothetical protein